MIKYESNGTKNQFFMWRLKIVGSKSLWLDSIHLLTNWKLLKKLNHSLGDLILLGDLNTRVNKRLRVSAFWRFLEEICSDKGK